MIDIQGNIIPDKVVNFIKSEISAKQGNEDVVIINLLLTEGVYQIEYLVFGMTNMGYIEFSRDYIIRKMKITDLGI